MAREIKVPKDLDKIINHYIDSKLHNIVPKSDCTLDTLYSMCLKLLSSKKQLS